MQSTLPAYLLLSETTFRIIKHCKHLKTSELRYTHARIRSTCSHISESFGGMIVAVGLEALIIPLSSVNPFAYIL